MKTLLLFCGCAAFTVWAVARNVMAAEPPSEQAQRDTARALLHKVYRAPATARFCTTNPEATYRVTIDKLVFDVDCKTRNEWLELAAKQ
jgi:hypothetical protein